jgi:hypothetical protein
MAWHDMTCLHLPALIPDGESQPRGIKQMKSHESSAT